VHDCDVIDPALVFDAIGAGLRDVPADLAAVQRFLERPGSWPSRLFRRAP
jgi:hypothetical protein